VGAPVRPNMLNMPKSASDQACPGIPVAVNGKVGVPSVSGGYSAADFFRTIGLMLFDRGHAKDVTLFGERFSALYRF